MLIIWKLTNVVKPDSSFYNYKIISNKKLNSKSSAQRQLVESQDCLMKFMILLHINQSLIFLLNLKLYIIYSKLASIVLYWILWFLIFKFALFSKLIKINLDLFWVLFCHFNLLLLITSATLWKICFNFNKN